MSTAALNAYMRLPCQIKGVKHKQEVEQPVSDTQIVANILKEHNSSSTFLSTMGYHSRSGRFRIFASTELVQDLEEEREPIEAHEMYQQQLTERVKAQESTLEEMQM